MPITYANLHKTIIIFILIDFGTVRYHFGSTRV